MIMNKVVLSLIVLVVIGAQTAKVKKCGFSRYLDVADIRTTNLTTPSYPKPFQGPAICEWELTAMYELQISVKNITPSSCNESILNFEDVEWANASLGTFCGTNLTTKVRALSKGSTIRVRFRILVDKPAILLLLKLRVKSYAVKHLIKDQKPGTMILSETRGKGQWDNWHGYLVGEPGISLFYVTIPNFNKDFYLGHFKVFSVLDTKEREEVRLTKSFRETQVKIFSNTTHMFFYYHRGSPRLPRSTIKFVGCGRKIELTSNSTVSFDVDMSLFPSNAECFYEVKGPPSSQLLIGFIASASSNCTLEFFDRPLSRDYPGPSYGYKRTKYSVSKGVKVYSDIYYIGRSTGLIRVAKGQSCDYKFRFNASTCGFTKTIFGRASGEINFNLPLGDSSKCTWRIVQNYEKEPWAFIVQLQTNLTGFDEVTVSSYMREYGTISKKDAGKRKSWTIPYKKLEIRLRGFGGKRSSLRLNYTTVLKCNDAEKLVVSEKPKTFDVGATWSYMYMACLWFMKNPEPGQGIMFRVTPKNPSQFINCSEDYLLFRDGHELKSPILAKICANTSWDQQVVSKNSSVRVELVKTRAPTNAGFTVEYSSPNNAIKPLKWSAWSACPISCKESQAVKEKLRQRFGAKKDGVKLPARATCEQAFCVPNKDLPSKSVCAASVPLFFFINSKFTYERFVMDVARTSSKAIAGIVNQHCGKKYSIKCCGSDSLKIWKNIDFSAVSITPSGAFNPVYEVYISVTISCKNGQRKLSQKLLSQFLQKGGNAMAATVQEFINTKPYKTYNVYVTEPKYPKACPFGS